MSPATCYSETAVFVHGLWMIGVDMALLRRRLAACGYRTVQFTYPTVRSTVRANAARLQRFLESVEGETVHFVGHSLGGLVIRWLFHDHPDQRPGRVVTLGTPHGASRVAEAFDRSPVGRLLLGRSGEGALLGGAPPWDSARELGVIAGTLSLGVGMFTPGLTRPHDGTVSVEETRLPGMTDFVQLRASHMGLLASREVARQTCAFLRHGHFVSGEA